VGDADYAPGATSATSAVNPITYTSSNTAVAEILSGNIRIIGAGTTIITASQASSANYNAATDVAQTLNVSGILPVIGAIQTLYSQNFNGLGSSATATLPTGFVYGSNWATGTTATTQAATTLINNSSGGLYNFGDVNATTDRAIGPLTVGTNGSAFNAPQSIILKITNNSGSPISSLNVSFDYEKYRTGSNQFFWSFFHGATSTANTVDSGGYQYYAADAINGNAVNPPITINKSFKISGLTIPVDSVYYIRWTYYAVGSYGNSQPNGIDNIIISANAGASRGFP
jgi:hypothetical protein